MKHHHFFPRLTIAAGLLALLGACGEDPVQPAGSSRAPVSPGSAGLGSVEIEAVPPSFNAAPVPSIGIQEFGRGEGKPIIFSGVGTIDPDRDTVTYLWSFGDGQSGIGRLVTHTYDDQGVYAVSLTAVDAHGATSTASTQLTIANSTPRPGTLSVPASLQEGVPFVLADIGASDAPSDMAAGLRYSFDCGSAYWTPFAASPATMCPGVPDNGSYLFRVRVLDKDGAMKMTSASGSAANVPPVVTFFRLEQHGGFLTASVIFSDVPRDVSSVRFSWGDGSASTVDGVVPGATAVASHRYPARGTYTLFVRVTDKDANRGGVSAVIVVS